MLRISSYLLICIAYGIVPVVAQEHTFAEQPYPAGFPLVETINVYENSTHLQNWDLIRNSQGVLFIGTIGNLVAYDGTRWSQTYIPKANTLSLALGNDDTVYVGGAGEFGFIDSTDPVNPLQYVSLSEELPDSVYDNLSDARQILPIRNDIFFRSGHYLIRWDGNSLTYWEGKDRIRLLLNNRGRLNLYVENNGVYDFDVETGLVPADRYSNFRDMIVFGIYPLDEQTDLVVTNDGGLFRVTDGTTEAINGEASQFLIANNVYESIQLYDGTYVVGTLNAGIVRFTSSGEILAHLDSNSGLEEDRIYSLYLDNDGALWASHHMNVSKIDFQLPIRKKDHRNGFHGDVNGTVFSEGKIYLTTFDGIFLSTDGGENFNQLVPGLSNCQSIEQVKSEIFVFCDESIYKLEEESITELATLDRIRFLKKSGYVENTLFIGTENGLMVMDLEDYSVSDRVPGSSGFLTTLEEYNAGVWFATTDGEVLCYELDELMNWLQDNNLELSPDRYIIEENRSVTNPFIRIFSFGERLLFSSTNNVYRFVDEEEIFEIDHIFGEDFNEGSRDVYRLQEDSYGNIWMRSNRQLIVAWNKGEDTYEVRGGLLNRMNDSQFGLIKEVVDGVIWFGGPDGVIVINNQEFGNMSGYKPMVHAGIRQVYIGTDSLVVDFLGKQGSLQSDYTFDYEHNQFRFTVGLPSFDHPDANRFQFRLLNFEEDWTAWTDETQKDYTNVLEGSYTFQVRARDVYGNEYESAGFAFTVLPPWYRTFWAYLLYLFTISGILYTAHKIKVERILEVQRIRNRIASDLHDEISATLSSISFFAEAIHQKKERNEEKERRFIELISKSAGEAKENMSDIIWSINPANDDWKALLAKCRRFASDMLESRDIEYNLDIAEDIPKRIDIELRQQIWLIFKEMVTNTARHSGAAHATVSLRYFNNAIHMKVADNGKGFNPDEVKQGNGIKNIKKRAEHIEAQLNVKSNDNGTVWKLTKSF